jgi:hypothetical protein
MSEKEPKPSDESAPSGLTEDMPTVTTLLDRRKLRAENEQASSTVAPTIKAVPRATERRRVQRLELWTPEALSAHSTPETLAVRLLLSERFDWALLLLKDEQQDVFETRAVAGGSRQRWAVWTGLRWSEANSPAVWKTLKSADYLGLTTQDQDQAALMVALGCEQGEQAWIFWVGPRERPLAILVTGARGFQPAPAVLEKVALLLR